MYLDNNTTKRIGGIYTPFKIVKIYDGPYIHTKNTPTLIDWEFLYKLELNVIVLGGGICM